MATEGEAASDREVIPPGRMETAEPTRFVRVSHRPPPRYAVSTDLDLWLKRFELYVRQTGIPENQWAAELLPLLDDESFRVVLQLGLTAETTAFSTITECLKQQFSPKGNELEWQRRLQTRKQQPGEQLVQYAGALRVLADKAYPTWTAGQRGEVLRNHFIQGVSSPSVQLRLMREMPETLEAALSLAIQQQSVETAQQRLHKEMRHEGSMAMALQQGDEGAGSECGQTGSNAVAPIRGTSRERPDPRVDEMARELRRLSNELAQLRGARSQRGFVRQQGPRGGGGRTVTCWNCGERGHIRRNCTRPRGERRQEGTQSYRAITATNNSALVIDGFVAGRPTKMLIDSGSAVTILREDVWNAVCTKSSRLVPPGSPVVVANGADLSLLGQTTASLQVAGVKVEYPCLVASQLTQECIIGADFLLKSRCVIDLNNRTVRAGGRTSHFRTDECSTPHEVCHVFFPETTVLPGNSEVQLPLSLSDPSDHGMAVLEPSRSFTEKHGVLIAHSLTLTGTRKALVRILNPSPAAVVIHENEKAGELLPIDEAASLCTLDQTSPQVPRRSKSASVDRAIEQLMGGTEGLQDAERKELHALLDTFSDVISAGEDDLGRTSFVQHHINTSNAGPVRQPRRRPLFHQQGIIQQHVDKMLKQGVIEPSDGPWSSPYVLVRKKDGSTRFCVDFRKVNDLTKKDAHPLPRIDDTLDSLGGAHWFSTIDLASGYWQVEVDPSDREKTAFATPDGLYQFRVMPFGLCNAPATFQRLMERVLQGLHWSTCLVYLDDIIIFSASVGDHLARLDEVLARLREAGLKLKPSKCQLLRKSVHYLGHVVSERGVETDPAKIECIANWPTPSNTKELKSFLGLASYYRRFVKGFAKVAFPLHRLSEKKVWAWSDECEQAFNSLKHRLITAPVLTLPSFDQDFVLDVDASGNGLGAVLSQAVDGGEQVVGYASRTLTKAEKSYCATRRELLALVWGIRHFRPYLYGREFTARTDHNSLKWLHNFREPEGQVARWLEILAEYNFRVIHRPGPQHVNADTLSRLPCRQCGQMESTGQDIPVSDDILNTQVRKEEQLPEVATVSSSNSCLPSWTAEELKSLQSADPSLHQAIVWLSTGSMPSRSPSRYPHLQSLWSQRHHLLLKDGILYRRWEDVPGGGSNKRLQLVLPPQLATDVLSTLHNSTTAGHLGVKKTLEKVRSRFYWYKQRQDVTGWCKSCPTCASRKPESKKRRAPLQIEPAHHPLERIAMDILGPLPETERGSKYILVIGDYFTKWKEAYPMKNMEAILPLLTS